MFWPFRSTEVSVAISSLILAYFARASSVLQAYGIDLKDAAFILWVAVRHAIAIKFDTHASKNIIKATMVDLLEAMRNESPNHPPEFDPAEWAEILSMKSPSASTESEASQRGKLALDFTTVRRQWIEENNKRKTES
eukprot:623344-Pleurochrysis_carterae.AAC.4